MGWSNGIAEWTNKSTAFISAVFSWNAQKAYQKAKFYQLEGYNVRCGGQAVWQNPAMFSEFDISGAADALKHHNSQATFTSRGCIRKCSFCLVPKLEGNLVELDVWDVKPLICDNNLLATSQSHFDNVIDRLLESNLTNIDFNQGLDARILTEHHGRRFAELPPKTIIRLAWDNIATEKLYRVAFNKLLNAGIKATQIRTYVLIGYKDTPQDALYRLETILSLGALPNPMRYQPLDAIRKNMYVSDEWTEDLLKRFVRYWSKLNWLGHIPFDEYKKPRSKKNRYQIEMNLS